MAGVSCHRFTSRKQRAHIRKGNAHIVTVKPASIPSVLEPDLDLFGFDIRENWALADKLLAANRTWLWALVIEPLEGFNLLRCVPNILAVVYPWFTILAGHFHLQSDNCNLLIKKPNQNQLAPPEAQSPTLLRASNQQKQPQI